MATKKLTKKQKSFIQKHPILVLLLAVAVGLSSYFYGEWNEAGTGAVSSDAAGKLQVHYIDVGQADAILVQMPTGENMLIDAGASIDGDVNSVKGADYLINYLRTQGVAEIDYFVITHPHSDHIASADEVIKTYGTNIGTVLLSDDTSSGWKTVANAMSKAGVGYEIVEAGDVYSLGKAEFTVLGPVDDSIFDDSARNHYSIVLRLVYGDTSFLFTGDAEKETENAILNAFPLSEIKSDVLKVAHHGSNTSSTDAFLKAVDADIAVICVGSENEYGHPTQKTLSRLTSNGYTVLRTDEEGTITLLSDGKTVSRLSDN